MKWLVFEKLSWKHVSQKTVPTTTADDGGSLFLLSAAAAEGSINVKQRMKNSMVKVNQDIFVTRFCVFVWENE